MKKIKYLMVLLLFMPLLVKADVSGPMCISKKYRVTNINGADIVDYEGTILRKVSYDDVFTGYCDVLIDNEIYINLEQWDSAFAGFIKPSDITLVTDKVDMEKYKSEYTAKLYVFDDSNVLYKGPSATYGKVEPETRLKVGSTIESKYYDGLWMYVEQDGVKGWVYTYSRLFCEGAEQPGLASFYNDKISYDKETYIYDSPKNGDVIDNMPNGNVIGVVPAGVELFSTYFYEDNPRTGYYYVTYNGTSGWMYVPFEYPNYDDTDYDTSDENSDIVDNNSNDNSIEPVQMIILCSLGAIIIVLTALVTIKLINEKKENK